MPRLTQVMPIQQHRPMKIDLAPVFTSLTTSVLKPIAAIAITMKNFDSVLIGAVTATGSANTVVMTLASEQAEALVAHAEYGADREENQRSDDVEEEDHADGLGNLLVIGIDDRCRGGNCGATADGGANAHKRLDPARDVHHAAQHERDDERRSDGRDDDGQGARADLGDLAEVEAEAQQDHRVLQDLLGRVLDARGSGLGHVGAATQHQAIISANRALGLEWER